jgi:hypothetical protein
MPTGHPSVDQGHVAKVHRILKVTAKKRLINGKRISALAKERARKKRLLNRNCCGAEMALFVKF